MNHCYFSLSLSLIFLSCFSGRKRETRGGKTCKLSPLSTSPPDLPLGLSMEIYRDHDHTQLINCHEESCSVKSLQLRQEQEVINLSPDERDNMLRFTVCDEEEKVCRSLKWMPSKIRLTGKMMNTHQTDREIQIDDTVFHEIEDQKLTSSPHCNFSIRVCAECNTTKTPLWRSGPRGPKSLCNACGIRQMKARRAAAMATVAEKGPHLSAETKTKKRRRRCNNCHAQMKKRCTTSEEKQYFQHIIRSLNRENNPSFKKTFPEEEKEAAILLMALSYGLVHG